MGTEQKPETSGTANNPDNENKFSKCFKWWRNPTDRFSFLLVVVTFLLFIATAGLYCATKDLVEDAKHTAERQLRAYIYIKEARMLSHGDNEIWEAQILFRNFGQTPAYGVTTPISFFPTVKASKYTFNEPPVNLDGPVQDWGPGQEIKVNAKSERPITPEEAAHFKDGSWVVFIYGEVRYRDAFGHQHVTQYRAKYNPSGSLEAEGVTKSN